MQKCTDEPVVFGVDGLFEEVGHEDGELVTNDDGVTTASTGGIEDLLRSDERLGTGEDTWMKSTNHLNLSPKSFLEMLE